MIILPMIGNNAHKCSHRCKYVDDIKLIKSVSILQDFELQEALSFLVAGPSQSGMVINWKIIGITSFNSAKNFLSLSRIVIDETCSHNFFYA